MTDLKEAPYNIDGDFSYDNNFPIERLEEAEKILRESGFKFPDKDFFRDRILQVYGYDIDEYKNRIIVLNLSDFPEMVVRDKFYIYVGYYPHLEYDRVLYWYNNLVFYKDKDAFNNLKSAYPGLLEGLVAEHELSKNLVDKELLYKEIVKYVFSRVNFSNAFEFEELLFYPEVGGTYIKKDLMDYIEEMVYGESIDVKSDIYRVIPEVIKNIELHKESYLNPDEIIAYLYDKTLRAGIKQYIQERLIAFPEYKYFLEDNNFFNLETLKKYIVSEFSQ